MADALVSINHTLGTVLYGLDARVPDEMSSGDTPCVSMRDISQLLDQYAIPHRELKRSNGIDYIQVLYCSDTIAYFFIYPKTVDVDEARVETKYKDVVITPNNVATSPEIKLFFTNVQELTDILYTLRSLYEEDLDVDKVWHYVAKACAKINADSRGTHDLSISGVPSNALTAIFSAQSWSYSISNRHTTIAYLQEIDRISCIIPAANTSKKIEVLHQGNSPLNVRYVVSLLKKILKTP
jgi:hypothetical protein